MFYPCPLPSLCYFASRAISYRVESTSSFRFNGSVWCRLHMVQQVKVELESNIFRVVNISNEKWTSCKFCFWYVLCFKRNTLSRTCILTDHRQAEWWSCIAKSELANRRNIKILASLLLFTTHIMDAEDTPLKLRQSSLLIRSWVATL